MVSWSPKGSQRNAGHNPNATDRNYALRDALDSMNHVCHTYDRSQICLEENDIEDYCLATTKQSMSMHINFQFICHQQQRGENLVRSLQCLHDTRLLAMLYLHIAQSCLGFGSLDDTMRRYKSALFYAWNIEPALGQAIPLESYLCIPKHVISTCIRGIVEDYCGIMTANFVQKHLLYYQDWWGQTLQSAGLTSNICNSDMSPGMDIAAPGTALDTVYGRHIVAYLQTVSGTELCTTNNIYAAYFACEMSADGRYHISKFNILQFAHAQWSVFYHGADCSRLQFFTACWDLLRETCGPKTKGLAQHAILLVDGYKIQSELETAGCHWQDMLLPHYLQASRETVWPEASQCLRDPMYLESWHYSNFNAVMRDLDKAISLLHSGVEEILKKCDSRPARLLKSLLVKVHYLQRDAFEYRNVTKPFRPFV